MKKVNGVCVGHLFVFLRTLDMARPPPFWAMSKVSQFWKTSVTPNKIFVKHSILKYSLIAYLIQKYVDFFRFGRLGLCWRSITGEGILPMQWCYPVQFDFTVKEFQLKFVPFIFFVSFVLSHVSLCVLTFLNEKKKSFFILVIISG